MASPATRTGRPQDEKIGERALAAAREILVERGFEATTIRAVAERSGVHVPAIYRRWPSRIELIEEATFPGLSRRSVRTTGDLRRDLRRFIRAYVSAFEAPAARAAAPGLLAHRHASPRTGSSDWMQRVSARPQLREIVRAAPPGSIDPEVDLDDVFDVLLGAVLVRILLPVTTGRRPPIERTVDMLIRLLRPAAPSPTDALKA